LADPPATVGELAAALDVPLDDIVATGMWDMGSFITVRFSATYEWDMYHEHPVASAADLARRRLISYHVHATGEHYPPAPPPVDPEERLAQIRALAAGRWRSSRRCRHSSSPARSGGRTRSAGAPTCT
jgi:hypothetical protein